MFPLSCFGYLWTSTSTSRYFTSIYLATCQSVCMPVCLSHIDRNIAFRSTTRVVFPSVCLSTHNLAHASSWGSFFRCLSFGLAEPLGNFGNFKVERFFTEYQRTITSKPRFRHVQAQFVNTNKPEHKLQVQQTIGYAQQATKRGKAEIRLGNHPQN